jgi:PAS domain S-box-containing protein
LESQAAQLQEQTAELETVNDELSRAESQLRAIIDSALDAIVTTDRHSVITAWNHQAERMFGWTADEAVGRHLSDTIIPPRHREAHERGVQRYLETGEHVILNRRVEITALDRERREFPVELTVAPARSGTTSLFSAFIRDLTAAKRVQQRIDAEHAVTRVLAESHTLDAAAPLLLRAIGERLGWALGEFWVIEDGAPQLRLVGLWNEPDAQLDVFIDRTKRVEFSPGVGLPGRVCSTGRPAWVDDITADQRFPRAEAARSAGLHGAFAFPVRAGDELLGVIEFFHRDVLEPDAGLLAAVDVIGGGIGQAVRRVRAEEERDRALEEMERINR